MEMIGCFLTFGLVAIEVIEVIVKLELSTATTDGNLILKRRGHN